MVRSNLTRRDFNKLAAAAFGGVVTGTMIGCGDKKDDDKKDAAKGSDTKDTGDGGTPETNLAHLVDGKNVCRGLNICKTNGKGTHDCAGTSSCHNLTADQSCGGDNECHGQGGCKGTAGINACETKGQCHVPLNPDAWAKTRKLFEAEYKKKFPAKKLGAAPPDPNA